MYVAMILAYVAAVLGFLAIGVIQAFIVRDMSLAIYVLPAVSAIGAALTLSNPRTSRGLLSASCAGWILLAFLGCGMAAFVAGLANGVAVWLSATYPQDSNTREDKRA